MQSDIRSMDPEIGAGSTRLPPGWEAHADEAGPYYWHVPSGTIRREPPGPADQPARPMSFLGCSGDGDFAVCGRGDVSSAATSPDCSSSSVSSPTLAEPAEPPASSVSASATDADAASSSLSTIRRRVRYLGWRYLDPEDVARAERSSGAVNRCILALAAAETAGDLCAQPATLELGRQTLRLITANADARSDVDVAAADDEDSEARPQQPPPLLMPPQPLLAIRLWGVGRRSCGGGVEDAAGPAAGRHFAYVARDDVGKYVCHVIDCATAGGEAATDADSAAVRIANAVCQRCRCLMSQRRRRQQAAQQQQLQRRQDLRLSVADSALSAAAAAASPFPSPQEEPSKTIPCQYLGSVPVTGPGGLDRLNAAIDAAVAEADSGARLARPVTARVSPSCLRFEPVTSSAAFPTASDVQSAVELRVRYLSFMGVSRASVRHAGFIAQTALGSFECHVCRCEPSCGPLCRTVEAACNLRYQKCLDSLAAGGAAAVAPATAAGAADSPAGSHGGGDGPATTVKADIVQAVASLFSGLRRLSIK